MTYYFKKAETLFFVIVGCLFLSQCTENRLAGTSTTTGNTITGVALDTNGTPIVGAEVFARSSHHVSKNVPSSTLLKRSIFRSPIDTSVFTDSLGRYTFSVHVKDTLVLELNHEGNLQWIKDVYASGLEGDTLSLDSVELEEPASLTGRINQKGGSKHDLWIVVFGTSVFSEVDSLGAFQLRGLATGNHKIHLIRIREDGRTFLRDTVEIENVIVESGKGFVLNEILLASTPSNVAISAVTCLEDMTELRPKEKIGSPVMTPQLKTVLLEKIPTIIELDLCKGYWYRSKALPDTMKVVHSYLSSKTMDYAFNNKLGVIFEYNQKTKTRKLIRYPHKWSIADIWEDQFYVYTEPKQPVQVFKDVAELVKNKSTKKLPAYSADFSFISIYDTTVFLYVEASSKSNLITSTTKSNKFTSKSVFLEALQGKEVVGIEAVSNINVYLMTKKGFLYLYNVKERKMSKVAFLRINDDLISLSQN